MELLTTLEHYGFKENIKEMQNIREELFKLVMQFHRLSFIRNEQQLSLSHFII